MRYRVLGKTGLKVSAVGFGSTELGMDYGIKVPGGYGRPDKDLARKILFKALDSGINFFDTAPSYGDSERLLGSAVSSEHCYIATKVNIEKGHQYIRASIEKSLRNLKREYLDIVQIHSATDEAVGRIGNLEVLEELRKKGLVRFIGISVYGLQDALTVAKKGFFDVLQIAYNILDQRIREEVLPEIVKNDIGLISRSTYFRGMLTEKVQHLGDDWNFFKTTANQIKDSIGVNNWDGLSEMALRFCLSTEGIDSVLIGIRTMEELEFAVKTEKKKRLSDRLFKKLLNLSIKDEYWLNPLNWYFKL